VARIGSDRESFAAVCFRMRISTHRRSFQRPLAPGTAWELVADWLASPVAWISQPGPEHARTFGELVTGYELHGHLVPDAQLAALAIEHRIAVCSTDTDFARFRELRRIDPLG
jgi:predicted nucleic acid-binding protein